MKTVHYVCWSSVSLKMSSVSHKPSSVQLTTVRATGYQLESLVSPINLAHTWRMIGEQTMHEAQLYNDLIQWHHAACNQCFWILCIYIYTCIWVKFFALWILSTYADVPLPPIIEHVTVGRTWINLTWDHNGSYCTNGKYVLSWQQWQSENASDDMNSSKILNPDVSIKTLKPGTTYIVTLGV